MTQGLAHRGPDSQRTWLDGCVGLGHTRLAIMDPAHSRQPLFNEDKSIVVVYNGEIYNHRSLRGALEKGGHIMPTKSDGEIIPHLFEEYGCDCFGILDGMFSIILVDCKAKRVYIARDRLGIKPLVTYMDDRLFAGASELTALLRHPSIPRHIDRQAVADFLTFGYPMGSGTVFEGIHSFPPGEIGNYNLRTGTLCHHPYWRPRFPRHEDYESEDRKALSARFAGLFMDVIRDHIDTDVPVCCYLSGGIDSSGVTAAVAAQRSNLTAFSLSFSQAHFDEMTFATAVADKSRVNLHIVPVDNPSVADLHAAILRVEQPQIFTLDIANQVLSAATRAGGFNVTLTGDGADEILGGYDHFVADSWRRRLGHRPGAARIMNKVLSNLGYPVDFHEFYKRVMIDEEKKVRSLFGMVPPWFAIWTLNNDIATPLLKNPGRSPLGVDGPLPGICERLHGDLKDIAPLNKAIYLEMCTRLRSWVLWKSDRNSMANSVEARVPYLDNRLIDFFSGLPPQIKMSFTKEKLVLRDGFANLLPASVLRRRKYAFNTPVGSLLRDQKRLEPWLGRDALGQTDLFNRQAIMGLLEKIRQPEHAAPFRQALEMQTLLGVLTAQMLLLHHRAS